MPPLVSVIMPSYNHEKYIHEAIEGILQQTCTDFELVIVDDASTDSSRQIIESYAREDTRIKTVFHQTNMGIARTVNDGIDSATGRFISFTASDDIWIKEKLEQQLEVLARDDSLVVWSDGEVIDSAGNSTGRLLSDLMGPTRQRSGNIFEAVLTDCYVTDKVLERRRLGDIRFNDRLRYSNDWQFNVELARRYAFHFIPKPLFKYRVHGANTGRDVAGCASDAILVNRLFLCTYGRAVSRKTRSRLHQNVATACFKLGRKSSMSACLWRAYMSDPLDPTPLVRLADLLTRDHQSIRKVLSPALRVARVVRWSFRRIAGQQPDQRA